VIVVSDASPLTALAKVDGFSVLQKLYGQIVISGEVYAGLVAGAGLAGAVEISNSPWIEVKLIRSSADLIQAQRHFGLGQGELSTMILAKEIQADLIIFDDPAARKIAQREGFKVVGTLSTLEACYRKGYLPELRETYARMLKRGIYANRDLIHASLESFHLPPL
jgi:predicted nucleic acid-binding protein